MVLNYSICQAGWGRNSQNKVDLFIRFNDFPTKKWRGQSTCFQNSLRRTKMRKMEMLMAGSTSMGGTVGAMGSVSFVVAVTLPLLLDVTLHHTPPMQHTYVVSTYNYGGGRILPLQNRIYLRVESGIGIFWDDPRKRKKEGKLVLSLVTQQSAHSLLFTFGRSVSKVSYFVL